MRALNSEKLTGSQFGTVVAYWLDYGTIKNLTGEVSKTSSKNEPKHPDTHSQTGCMALSYRIPERVRLIHHLHPPLPPRNTPVRHVSPSITTTPSKPPTNNLRWLYSHDRKAEAVEVLARLQGTTTSDPAVLQIEEEMATALRLEKESVKFSIRDLINDRTPIKNTRRLVICFMIQFWQQFTGINVIAFYITIVLEQNVGLSRETSSMVSGCIQIAFWLGTFPPIFLLDRWGRRPILLGGSIALLTAMTLFTAGIAVKTPATSNMALAMLFLYEISFGMSWNAIPWLYAPEITPMQLRHVGAAVSTFSEWLWTFVRSRFVPLSQHEANGSPIGHCPNYTSSYRESWMEVLPSFLRYDCSKHSVRLLLVP